MRGGRRPLNVRRLCQEAWIHHGGDLDVPSLSDRIRFNQLDGSMGEL